MVVSLTHVHRCISHGNPNWYSLVKSERLTYLSVYARRVDVSETTLSPSAPSAPSPPSLSRMYTGCIGYLNPNWNIHRCIGYHNPNWHSLPKSVRLTYLSVYDSNDDTSDPALYPSHPSSLTYVHRCIGYLNPN